MVSFYWQITALGCKPGWSVTTLRHVSDNVWSVVAENFAFSLRLSRGLKCLTSGTSTLEVKTVSVSWAKWGLCSLFLSLGLCVICSLGPPCPPVTGKSWTQACSCLAPTYAKSTWQMWSWVWEGINLRPYRSLELSLGFCLGSVGTLNQNGMWPQDWLASVLINWNRHTCCGFRED